MSQYTRSRRAAAAELCENPAAHSALLVPALVVRSSAVGRTIAVALCSTSAVQCIAVMTLTGSRAGLAAER